MEELAHQWFMIRVYCSKCATMLQVVGPADLAEVGHPAGDRHVANVATAVDEGRPREEDRQQAQVKVIVRHLIDHAGRRGVELIEPRQCRVLTRQMAALSSRPSTPGVTLLSRCEGR